MCAFSECDYICDSKTCRQTGFLSDCALWTKYWLSSALGAAGSGGPPTGRRRGKRARCADGGEWYAEAVGRNTPSFQVHSCFKAFKSNRQTFGRLVPFFISHISSSHIFILHQWSNLHDQPGHSVAVTFTLISFSRSAFPIWLFPTVASKRRSGSRRWQDALRRL